MNMEKRINLKIRSAVSTDIVRLVGLDHTCSSDYVWQLDLQQKSEEIITSLREVRLPRSMRTKYPRDHFSLADEWNINSRTFVAVHDGVALGYIRLLEQVTSQAVWILDLVVGTEARREGVATALIQYIESWSLKRNNRQLFIEMSSKNNPAIKLVKNQGFAFSGYNDHYYATQDVALFFGKILK